MLQKHGGGGGSRTRLGEFVSTQGRAHIAWSQPPFWAFPSMPLVSPGSRKSASNACHRVKNVSLSARGNCVFERGWSCLPSFPTTAILTWPATWCPETGGRRPRMGGSSIRAGAYRTFDRSAFLADGASNSRTRMQRFRWPGSTDWRASTRRCGWCVLGGNDRRRMP